MPRNLTGLVYGSIISLAMLITLFMLRHFCPQLLDIDTKWLAVAGLPILIALIIGRFFTKFSGFGVSIEMAAEKPIYQNDSIIDLIESFRSIAKDEPGRLDSINHADAVKYNALLFETGPGKQYNLYTVRQYLERLPRVKYFIVNDARGRFEYLLEYNRRKVPVATITDNIRYGNFIEAINGTINFSDLPQGTFGYVINTATVIETYREMLRTEKNLIAVVDKEKHVVGVVRQRRIEWWFGRLMLKNHK